MPLGRTLAYAHRNRIGTNFHQLPVNRPRVPGNSYMFDGSMTFGQTGQHAAHAPYSDGRPFCDLTGPVEEGWESDAPMVRSAIQVPSGRPVRSGRHPRP
jgi:catalase